MYKRHNSPPPLSPCDPTTLSLTSANPEYNTVFINHNNIFTTTARDTTQPITIFNQKKPRQHHLSRNTPHFIHHLHRDSTTTRGAFGFAVYHRKGCVGLRAPQPTRVQLVCDKTAAKGAVGLWLTRDEGASGPGKSTTAKVVPADSSSSIPADNVPADSSSSVPADYVSAGHKREHDQRNIIAGLQYLKLSERNIISRNATLKLSAGTT
ncbi:hypothetical protein Tco_1541654 [Tanacetum coccineum]